jgi:hypothetical protein
VVGGLLEIDSVCFSIADRKVVLISTSNAALAGGFGKLLWLNAW